MSNDTISFSGDNFTEQIGIYMDEISEKIYEIDDRTKTIVENEGDIIAYLNSVRCTLSLGMAIRRHLCGKFGKKNDNGYEFVLTDGTRISVTDFLRRDYDIQNEDIKEYTAVFWDIYQKFNSDLPIPKFTIAEARRLLRVDSACQRKKMFEISFALHVNPGEMNKFLTDVLALQTYSMRDPKEIIAYFCHSKEEYNSYAEYVRLVDIYEKEIASQATEAPKKSSYTSYATESLNRINSEKELLDFLKQNHADFEGYSQTAYREFRQMYDKACEKIHDVQSLSNDEYLSSGHMESLQQRLDREARLDQAVMLRSIGNSAALAKKLGIEKIGNPEQLAHRMLQFIPRATFERSQNGKTVVSSDFISISNGEAGQKNKKVQTTTLPKDITMNLLMRDRLDDLLLQLKPVERKDLVFLKYFLFSLDLQEKDSYTYADYLVFREECDDMLMRCGMSRLYAANRFENLVMLSLLSSDPFEMFEDIIENSFINEPGKSEED